jgi:hypothetical protein
MAIKQTLTSVKVNEELFQEFKISCVKHKFSLQKLVDRSIYLYLKDMEYQRQMHNTEIKQDKE